jgi:hypothetical protein
MLWLAAVVVGGAVDVGRACMCAGAPVRKAVRGADRVFAGEVVAMELRQGKTIETEQTKVTVRLAIYTIKISHVWKGPVASEVRVTNAHLCSCGYDFDVDERYLVFAAYRDSVLWTRACVGNQRYDVSGGARYLLGAPSYTAIGAESAEVSREQLMRMLSSEKYEDVVSAAMAFRDDPVNYDEAVARLVLIIWGEAEGVPRFARGALERTNRVDR